jgi:Zn ribbon nucleic-acid-binding protein
MNEGRIDRYLLKCAEKLELVQTLTARDCKKTLVILRMKSRCVIDRLIQIDDENRQLDRQEHLLKSSGVTALPVAYAKESARKRQASVQDELVSCGAQIMDFLDLWEEKGATRLDLCHLCGHEHRRTLREIATTDNTGKYPFSRLVFVCNLDYRNDRADFIDYETDAPLTHAVKEYILDIMIHTDAGQVAAQEAFEAVFPVEMIGYPEEGSL